MVSTAPMATSVEAAEPTSRSYTRFTREQVVDRIMELNPSVRPEFLASFRDDLLRAYLSRLETIQEPRGRRSTWVRRTQTPAIVVRDRLD